MMMQKILREEQGFTIQELLVVIVTGSLLVGFAYAFYLFVAQMAAGNLRMREHRLSAQRIVGMIALDIERSTLVRIEGSTLSIYHAGRPGIVYRTAADSVMRNQQLLAPAGEGRWCLKASRSVKPANSVTPSFDIELRGRWAHDSCSIRTQVSIPWNSKMEYMYSTGRTLL